MISSPPPSSNRPFARLRQLVRNPGPAVPVATPVATPVAAPIPAAPAERCDLCGKPLSPRHEHVVEPANRRLLCCCDPCAILFTHDGADARFRRVPRRVKRLADVRLTDAQWEGLSLPINLAFFLGSTPAGRVVALFPSPAGPTESLLPLEAWREVVDANPVVGTFGPDVEALLVNRLGERRNYYRVPVDDCYKLVGLLRAYWRGLSGGTEVWRHVKAFFDDLDRRAGEGGGRA